MIGDRVKKIREDLNIDAKDLAAEIGITPAYLSLIESNKRTNPSMNILKKIANALNVTIGELVSGNADFSQAVEDFYEGDMESDEDIHKEIINKKFKPIIDSLDRAGDLQDDDIDEIASQLDFLIELKRKKNKNSK